MKVWIRVIVGFFVALQCASVSAEGIPVQLTATNAVLIEARTGKVLFDKDADRRVPPASTTKMTTLIVALENGNPEDIVTVGERAAGTEGSSLFLSAGDRLKMEELLYGIMLESANDATVAVAEHLSGSVEAFAIRMTETAREIGADNTHFVNSSGLPDPAHYTTARDLALIAAYGERNPAFARIVSTKEREISWIEPEKTFAVKNTNLLLGSYPGIVGTKTGYTKEAGECLVASAERDGVRLVAVVMHADDDLRWQEAAALLDYGFSKTTPEVLASRDALAQKVLVHEGTTYKVTARPANDIVVAVSDGDRDRYSYRVELPQKLRAPVEAGQAVGAVSVLYDGREVDRMELLSEGGVEAGFNLFSMIALWYETFFSILTQFQFF